MTQPAALLLHGGPGLPDYLDELADELAPVFEPVRHAQRTTPPYAVEDYVADAVAAIDAAGRECVWLVGHSWGGHLALHVAVAAPARVAGARVHTLHGVGHFPWLERPGIVREAIVDSGLVRSS
jgi:pimeloyl-ACP methyl ester carboxylesterase